VINMGTAAAGRFGRMAGRTDLQWASLKPLQGTATDVGSATCSRIRFPGSSKLRSTAESPFTHGGCCKLCRHDCAAFRYRFAALELRQAYWEIHIRRKHDQSFA
jgi:hypothetical protein